MDLLTQMVETILFLGSFNALRYFVIAGIPFLLLYKIYAKKVEKMKIQQQHAANADFYREILHSIQAGFITAGIITLVIKTDLKQSSLIYTQLNDYPIYWLFISYILAIIIHDTWFYWLHRFFHLPRIYAKVHRMHHLSVNPSPWTSFSFHFLEAIGEGLVIIPLVFMIPIHLYTLFFFGFSIFMINVYGHLGYEIAPKWFRQSILFKILNTSVHHNLHHSKFKGNYGLYFRFWDRMMGTENPEYEQTFDDIQAKRFPNTSASQHTLHTL
jgi:sterol desaturase/sphingolipid hydroxylase (fatty acid hydroxylase superfamily)